MQCKYIPHIIPYKHIPHSIPQIVHDIPHTYRIYKALIHPLFQEPHSSVYVALFSLLVSFTLSVLLLFTTTRVKSKDLKETLNTARSYIAEVRRVFLYFSYT